MDIPKPRASAPMQGRSLPPAPMPDKPGLPREESGEEGRKTERRMDGPAEGGIRPAFVEAMKLGDLRKYPPLFIKLDKYGEMVSNMDKLKATALTLRDALDALDDVEKELRNGLAITQKALDNFNMVVAALDTKLLRVDRDDSEAPERKAAPREVDSYIKDVYDQVERIKGELRGISRE
jgi:hypothetical protein